MTSPYAGTNALTFECNIGQEHFYDSTQNGTELAWHVNYVGPLPVAFGL